MDKKQAMAMFNEAGIEVTGLGMARNAPGERYITRAAVARVEAALAGAGFVQVGAKTVPGMMRGTVARVVTYKRGAVTAVVEVDGRNKLIVITSRLPMSLNGVV